MYDHLQSRAIVSISSASIMELLNTNQQLKREACQDQLALSCAHWQYRQIIILHANSSPADKVLRTSVKSLNSNAQPRSQDPYHISLLIFNARERVKVQNLET